MLRLTAHFKRSRYHPSSTSKVCQAFVISSNHYGSFRTIPSFYHRSDSLFSNEHLTVIVNNGTIYPATLTPRPLVEQQTKATLLEHYLTTYNPLHLDLTRENSSATVKAPCSASLPSETDTHPVNGCYPLPCANKQRIYHHDRYVRLIEQQPRSSSANISSVDERLSECSTRLTLVPLPVIMVTDCSDEQRLHTDIIEMN